MKRLFKKLTTGFILGLLQSIFPRFDHQADTIRIAAESENKNRILLKRSGGMPINVLFVCHEPALWSMFESIYKVMLVDDRFSPLIVVLPYKHESLADGQFKDSGMLEFLKLKGFPAISGYDGKKDWLNPKDLGPDYVFFQTPYSFFASEWSIEQISLIARVCYIPYATCLFKGQVEEILHPEIFYRHVHFKFVESSFAKQEFELKFGGYSWYNGEYVIASGHPKLDYLTDDDDHDVHVVDDLEDDSVWKRGLDQNIKRILWTPRWNSEEGACHFFDYKDFFIQFCRDNPEVDFAFRPHPLCFWNFLKSGELTAEELSKMDADYALSPNMVIDQNGEYHDTFLSSDILVSDISSMMLEYLATGKPIVYSHRVDQFNKLGKELSKGMYQVCNEVELMNVLRMLLSGEDPLRSTREQLIGSLLFLPERGASLIIKNCLQRDFTT